MDIEKMAVRGDELAQTLQDMGIESIEQLEGMFDTMREVEKAIEEKASWSILSDLALRIKRELAPVNCATGKRF